MNSEQVRIQRIKKRYCEEIPHLSIQRAYFYTEYFKQHEHDSRPMEIKVAEAMKYVFQRIDIYLSADEKIAGTWCEFFSGVPIDIERGVFNQVLETELSKPRMLFYRFYSSLKTIRFIVRKRKMFEAFKSYSQLKKIGTLSLDMEIKTMEKRKINPFTIDKHDKKILLNKLLPYWKTRSIIHHLEKKLDQSGLYSENMHDFIKGIPGNTSRQVQMVSTCATIASMQGHVILDYDRVVKVGLFEMLQESEQGTSVTSQAIHSAIEGVIIFAERVRDQIKCEMEKTIDPIRKLELKTMFDICTHVPFYPAKNFREAIQSLWMVKTATEIANPVNLSCFGRLDQLLFPYYENDLKNNTITEEEAVILLAELLLKTMSLNVRPETNVLSNFYHRYLGSTPVTIGGLDENGHDATNALTYLFIKASNLSRAVTNISIRVHPQTPESLYLLIAQSLREGNSALSFYNDEINIKSLLKRNFELKDAYNYAVVGCVELIIPGKTGGMSANALLLSRILDLTLRNGDSKTLLLTVKAEGERNADHSTFDKLVDSFIQQAQYFLEKTVKASALRDQVYAEYSPAPYISAFIEGPLVRAKDVTSGGALFDMTGVSYINSIANVVDSLYVIKKLVFDQKKYTIADFIQAIDHHFIGYQQLYQDIKSIEGKWGNGASENDQLAREISTRLFQQTYHQTSFKSNLVVPYMISMTSHTIDGKLSIATPDGRKALSAYAASGNPYNVECSGLTNTIRSIAAMDYVDTLGCAINIKFHPNAIGENESTQKKWIALLKTYFQLGIPQMQPTVASKQMLIEAVKNPDQYRDLIIKVGGYSTYFVDLGIDIQNEIIARTEHV